MQFLALILKTIEDPLTISTLCKSFERYFSNLFYLNLFDVYLNVFLLN